jgi:catechol 2,3-dioxygenase-like lactoylglutathione lyase family enzyme
MLDHVFLPVTDLVRSISFYESALSPLGFSLRVDFDGKDGPPGHPDLKGFGKDGRFFLWLRKGRILGDTFHVGFVAASRDEVLAAHAAAMKAGARDNGAPGIRAYYDPRYYAANVFDPDAHSIEFVYKSWQHPQS